ncbi:MAG: hypothetical protein Kow0063_00230 [Anaerolineae bacterium]
MAGPIQVDGVPIRSIRQINALPEKQKSDIYRRLIPEDLLAQFGIDPVTWLNADGVKMVDIEATPGTSFLRIRVFPAPDFPDPLFQLELGDTGNHQLEILLVIINDPCSERFDVDRDWAGEPTKFGLRRRNLQEEERAMRAGLAPGQVRRGLRQMSRQQRLVEDFAAGLGHEAYLANPLGYHNAIFLEWQGFGYIRGRRKMEWIHREFQPGGELFQKLDGSTPFRHPDMANTVRGRSWAIHDGILGEPWPALEVSMFKRVGHHAGQCTFPDAAY